MTSALPRGLARIRDVVMSLQLLLPVFLITNKCINLDNIQGPQIVYLNQIQE